ncbi:hypothetical protein [Nonomuraea jabiensis]|uniref:Transposase n=1 Tax=Nonomuraea jabiensis TaxID=882448 RepID=A0A7W9G2U4_9ACTN|nr:hypothetical protein [Nonomuraea jabiensis]MBB5776224.1 transposase [Nonomuraea jabiensis]
MPPEDNAEGRPRARAASRVDINGLDATSVRHTHARRTVHALRGLRPADRARVLGRLAELRDLETLARQRGTLAA